VAAKLELVAGTVPIAVAESTTVIACDAWTGIEFTAAC
jgi:hypothetical protein